jgi:hypothetical protein
VAVLVALIVAACNGGTASPGATSPSASVAGASGSPDGSIGGSEAPSDEPTTSPMQSPSVEPTDEPSPSSSSGGPSSSPTQGGTGACFGSAETRDFFSSFAQSVPWPVYCAVLPKGWSVEKGTYRLGNGGRLTISYRRRADGARIVLDEGAVCAETNPCVGPGSDLGTIEFSDRQADLSSTASGLAAVVDKAENPAWLLTGTGLGQGDFATIAAKLHLIDL